MDADEMLADTDQTPGRFGPLGPRLDDYLDATSYAEAYAAWKLAAGAPVIEPTAQARP